MKTKALVLALLIPTILAGCSIGASQSPGQDYALRQFHRARGPWLSERANAVKRQVIYSLSVKKKES